RMNILDHDLKSIEAACFGILHFLEKVDGQVFIDDAVACSKKSKYMADKIALVGVHFVLPIMKIGRQIYLFGRPETGLGLFVKLPNVLVLDRKDHKAIFVVL